MNLEEQIIQMTQDLSILSERCQQNTLRIKNLEDTIKEFLNIAVAIKELAVETKHMREDLNQATKRLNKLETKDGESWTKFKWAIVAGIITLGFGILTMFIYIALGLKTRGV